MQLKVVLGIIGVALICVGLVAILGEGEIGCQRPQTKVNRIDTEEEVIGVATQWARTTNCRDLIAGATRIGVTDYGRGLWGVSYYSSARLIEEITFTPRTITYLAVIVMVSMRDGAVERCCYRISPLLEDFQLSDNYHDFLKRAYRSGESGCEDF